MQFALPDRLRINSSVASALRSGSLPIGDVVALDALIPACVAALQTQRIPQFEPIQLHAGSAVPSFIVALGDAVEAVAGSTYRDTLAALSRSLSAMNVRDAGVSVLFDPLDDIDIIIERWVERISDNDRATAVHSRAVGAWSRRMAVRLGLGDVADVARCGTIHDIGKMYTPRDILLAARPLERDEWDVMQRHVADGWQIVRENEALWPFASVVRGHHERFAGGGYPDGVAGSAIELRTRIVTVADSFNAMIGNRPYRMPMSPLAALAELEKHRGTQFDPDCVDAMADVVTGRTS